MSSGHEGGIYKTHCWLRILQHLISARTLWTFSVYIQSLLNNKPANMPSATSSTNFPVLHDAEPANTTLPAFLVSTTRGFLPRADPPATLPATFAALESLLQRMPVVTLTGEPGLLASGTGALGAAVLAELTDLTDAVDEVEQNLPLVNALYRDYAFLASAYLLEPCHERFVKGEQYGLARSRLPKQIARPIARCAKM